MKKIIKYVLLGLMLCLKLIAGAQVSLGHFALRGLTIIDVNHQTLVPNQTILITDQIISEVFTDGTKPIPGSFHILNLQGKYLLPGLIDTHVHMATDPSGVDNRAHTLTVLQNMLFTGITSVRDMAGDARTLAGLSRDALNGDIVSPDIYYSALMAGPVFFSDLRTASSTKGAANGKMPYMLAVTDSTNMKLAVAAAKGCGATGIKLYANLSAELVYKIVTEANKQGMIVWGHAWLQEAKPSDLVKAGVGSISHAPLLAYEKIGKIPADWKNKSHTERFWDDSVPKLDDLFELMKQHHTIFDATLLTYKKWGEADTSMRYSYEIARRITASAYKAGVKICAGTDDDQEAFVQAEMKLLVTDAGFKPIDAIIAATLHAAEVLHIENTRGSIEPKKVADILVLDKNPLSNIENINSVYLVIKDGRLFKK